MMTLHLYSRESGMTFRAEGKPRLIPSGGGWIAKVRAKGLSMPSNRIFQAWGKSPKSAYLTLIGSGDKAW